MPAAIATSTLQLVGVGIAAVAAVASWLAVLQARLQTKEARAADREDRLPLLLVSVGFVEGAGNPTMWVTIHNAGGGVAQNVAVLLVTEDAFARTVLGLVLPGESVYFASNVLPDPDARAVVYTRTVDRRELVWNLANERRELPGEAAAYPEFKDLWSTFYDDEVEVDHRNLGQLLRG